MIQFNKRERHLLLYALRIAHEDGSIYGGADSDQDMRKIDAEIAALQAKLRSTK
jgi:hypothetical protein